MKIQRHAAILKVVRDRPIGSQDELRAALVAEGFDVTQATLSRDIRELGLVKLVDAQGRALYTHPQRASVRPDMAQVIGAFFVGQDGVGPLLVLKTAAGAGGAVAGAIDEAGWAEVVGTIAGDDTVLVITRGQRQREQVAERLEAMVK
jgi:transcriptional regulator of arginine metabolism